MFCFCNPFNLILDDILGDLGDSYIKKITVKVPSPQSHIHTIRTSANVHFSIHNVNYDDELNDKCVMFLVLHVLFNFIFTLHVCNFRWSFIKRALVLLLLDAYV